MKKMPRFAVILSGCGRLDGSEIHETVTALLAIDGHGCTYQCFAPNVNQSNVMNNLTSQKTDETRNVLVESARIARGDIKPLSEFNVKEFDCLLLPGGLGAITNWCDFNTKGLDCNIEDSISNTLNTAYKEHLVIGAMCIAPVVLALVLGKHNIKLTIGNDEKVAQNIEKTGAIHINTDVNDACVDDKNLIVTTPAYMLAKSIKEVFNGANSMVAQMIKLATKNK